MVGKKFAIAKNADYLSVLSCFYAVGPDAEVAYHQWCQHGCEYEEQICEHGNLIVASWGTRVPDGLLNKTMGKIEKWVNHEPSNYDPRRAVVCVDPTLPQHHRVVDEVTVVRPTCSPGNPVFVEELMHLAGKLNGYWLGPVDEAEVLEGEE